MNKKIYDINIDYLRGLLALYIVFYHILSWNHFIDINGNSIFLKFALYFVSIFFIISGYALTVSSINHSFNFLDSLNVFNYFKRRLARIYPLFLFVIIMSILIGYVSINNIDDLLYQMTITFLLFNKSGLTPGAWSIGVEIIFYLIFPIIYVIFLKLFQKDLIRNMVLIIFILLLIYFSSIYNYYEKFNQNKYFFIYTHNFYNHLYFFLIGMFIAFNRTFFISLKESKCFKYIIFLFIFIFIIFNFSYSNKYWNFLVDINRWILSLSSMALFLYFLLFLKLNKTLEYIFSLLGIISYTIYLVHPIFIYIFTLKIHKIDNIFWVMFCIIFIILLSVIIFYYYENPMRKLINNLKVD